MIALLLITSKWFFLTFCLSVFLGAHGCGQLPAGQEKTTNFAVTDFKLTAIMAYSEDPADKTRVSTISSTKNEAEAFVRRLIIQSVEDVLYQQGRSAFLSDSVISLILQQLRVQISYEPLKCDRVVTDPTMVGNFVDMKMNCITKDGTIVNICDKMANMCQFPVNAMSYKRVPPMHLSISGSLKTSNAIMANWSNQMWESILNRILRRMISSQYGSHFFGASVRLT